MTELYEKSLKKLELDLVLDKLAECAHSQEAKDRCKALLPLEDEEEIRLLLVHVKAGGPHLARFDSGEQSLRIHECTA